MKRLLIYFTCKNHYLWSEVAVFILVKRARHFRLFHNNGARLHNDVSLFSQHEQTDPILYRNRSRVIEGYPKSSQARKEIFKKILIYTDCAQVLDFVSESCKLIFIT